MTNQPNEVYNPLAKRTSVRIWSMPCSVGRRVDWEVADGMEAIAEEG